MFSRVDTEPAGRDDRVVVALDVPAGATLPVAPVFADGQALRDARDGTAYVVRGGSVTIAHASRVVLLERVAH